MRTRGVGPGDHEGCMLTSCLWAASRTLILATHLKLIEAELNMSKRVVDPM